jgi:DNA primase
MIMNAIKIDAYVLKSQISVIDFYQSEGQGIKTSGNSKWKEAGICPFHDDRKAGSFRINVDNGAFKCFSCGAAGGDIIAFIMQKYDLSFKESLKLLATKGGIA